ncbi:MAG: nucleotidyl transferase AbiEii/AbiGii toxin family protein [Betaproteobacteria bacterium]|nr:nucleotidyl transferase AbiEii/AbiGii toxin family protein [Betaproteobacteria bacterium]
MDRQYVDAVRLLLTVAPVIFESPRFALKGGTAINLFVQDLPRLSVDIDVVFANHALERESALIEIGNDLQIAQVKLEHMGYSASIHKTHKGDEAQLLVADQASLVKVEVNLVFRGTLLPVAPRTLVSSARNLFTTSMELPVLAISELYGSKLVAALDRQHPRDWFDIAAMIDGLGLETPMVDCFVAYLAGHNRPVHEVLFSNDLPLDEIFSSDLVGMTAAEIPLRRLIETRRYIRQQLPKVITDAHRHFLLSLVRAEPDWSLMPFEHLKDLPAIRWKLLNLKKLRTTNKARFEFQATELMDRFDCFPL